MGELENIYGKYKKETNMSCSELRKWAKNKCSREASIGRTAINRNLRLLCKRKINWSSKDMNEAKKAVSYLRRAKEIKSDNIVKGCGMTRNSIALKNWAYDDSK